MKLPPVVLIEWYDAAHPGGQWAAVSDVADSRLATIHTCGFLIHENKSRLIVAASYDGENVSGEMTIPTRMIRRRKTIAKAKETT